MPVHLRYLDVCMYVSPILPQFPVIEVDAISCLISWRKLRFRGRGCWKQVKTARIPTTKADLFLRIFKPIPELWNALKPFWMWKHFKTLRNGANHSKHGLKVSRKNILLVCVLFPHAGEYATALCVILFFVQKCYFAAWFGIDLFRVVERSKIWRKWNLSCV